LAETIFPVAPAEGKIGTIIRSLRARQGSFAYGSLITLVFNGASVLAYALGSILVARALGPEQMGRLLWFIAGTTIVAMFADILGVYYSNAYLIARGNHDLDIAAIRGTVLAYGAFVGVLAGLIFGWSPVGRAAIFRGYGGSGWGLLIAANVLGLVLMAQTRGLFWGKSQFILLGMLGLGKSAGYAIFAVAVVYGLGRRLAHQVAWAHVLATWATVLGAIFFLALRGLSRPRFSYLKSCVAVGWRAAAINWLSFLHQRADQYLVNVLLGPAALGLYGVVVSLGEVITQVPGVLGMVLFPLTAGDRNQRRAARSTLARTLVAMSVIALLMIPLAIFAPFIVHLLFGDRFAGAARLLRLFVPAIISLSGLLMVNQHLAGMGYPMYQFGAMLASLAVNLGLNIILLPRLNVVGAPISAALSYAIWLLLVGAYLVKKAEPGWRAKGGER